MLDKVGRILSQYQNSNVIASTIIPQLFETTIKTIYIWRMLLAAK
jgi:hypothetical protein